jgi:hypothetical protein
MGEGQGVRAENNQKEMMPWIILCGRGLKFLELFLASAVLSEELIYALFVPNFLIDIDSPDCTE